MAATASLPQLRPPLPAVTRPRPRLRPVSSPTVILLANGNASGIVRHPELVDGARSLLRTAGARVETQVTSSIEELGAIVSESGRRVILLGGDGSVHAVANLPGAKPELAHPPGRRAQTTSRAASASLSTSMPPRASPSQGAPARST